MNNEPYLSFARNALARAENVKQVTQITRSVARRLTRADGASVVLRETDFCFYADEDAVGPLWKGKRFPITSCISGWAMIHKQTVAIPDIYLDKRVPHDAYRPTFVHSLAMTPMGHPTPIGALGIYWSDCHTASPQELALLRALADLTAAALERCDGGAQASSHTLSVPK